MGLDISGRLQSIEIAVWLIAGLMLVSNLVTYVQFRKRRAEQDKKDPDWSSIVERAYEKGEYAGALQTLAAAELLLPKSASIKFWQGRCYFQLEAWDKAAAKFQECCRLEPFYRGSVKDYMAFIELNELAEGVEGYLEK